MATRSANSEDWADSLEAAASFLLQVFFLPGESRPASAASSAIGLTSGSRLSSSMASMPAGGFPPPCSTCSLVSLIVDRSSAVGFSLSSCLVALPLLTAKSAGLLLLLFLWTVLLLLLLLNVVVPPVSDCGKLSQ